MLVMSVCSRSWASCDSGEDDVRCWRQPSCDVILGAPNPFCQCSCEQTTLSHRQCVGVANSDMLENSSPLQLVVVGKRFRGPAIAAMCVPFLRVVVTLEEWTIRPLLLQSTHDTIVFVAILLGGQDLTSDAVFQQKDFPRQGTKEPAGIQCDVETLKCLHQLPVTLPAKPSALTFRLMLGPNKSHSFAVMSVGTCRARTECRNAVSRVSTPVFFTSSTLQTERPTLYTCGRCL